MMGPGEDGQQQEEERELETQLPPPSPIPTPSPTAAPLPLPGTPQSLSGLSSGSWGLAPLASGRAAGAGLTPSSDRSRRFSPAVPVMRSPAFAQRAQPLVIPRGDLGFGANLNSRRGESVGGSDAGTPRSVTTPRRSIATPRSGDLNQARTGDDGDRIEVPGTPAPIVPGTPASAGGRIPGTPNSIMDHAGHGGGGNRGAGGGSGGGGAGGGGGDGGGGGGPGGEDLDEILQGPGPIDHGDVIWGTTVNFTLAKERFANFIRTFRRDDMDDDEDAWYIQLLGDVHDGGRLSVEVDCRHLVLHGEDSRTFFQQLVHYPEEVVRSMDDVINEEYRSIYGYGEHALPQGKLIQVRPFNLREETLMGMLQPSDISQLVMIKGMVTRCSSIIPDVKFGYFRCCMCGYEVAVAIHLGHIEEPARCAGCLSKDSMTMIHNRSMFTDKQVVRLQETPEDMKEGETPQNVLLFVFDELVDTVRPGDRVVVTGIFRAVPSRQMPGQTVVRSIYKTYIDTLHFKTLGAGESFGGQSVFSPAMVTRYRNLARDPDVYNKLVSAIAPSIWELDDVKRGILCQMFGGNDQLPTMTGDGVGEEDGDSLAGDYADPNMPEDEAADGTRANRKRGEINVLMCGDPGTSKSQLLSFVHKAAPRGIYASGKGSSAVGLTASVIRDPETRDLVLESGALVLSDNGVCCIDEFDKMSDETRAVLHEAMEQQTVSIAKAGIVCTLNARTAILASANPVESRYNPRLSVIENIKLPPTLLSRFDLIYLILDKPNASTDRKLARFLVGLYYEEPSVPEPPIDKEFLKGYVSYARKVCHPRINDAAVRDLIKGYMDMRRMGMSAKTITATPRQLESLIRLSEALAKMRLSNWVVQNDVAEAIRLMRVSTQTAATDPRTGTIDLDMINTGHTITERDSMTVLASAVRDLLTEHAKTGSRRMTLPELRRRVQAQSDVDVDMDEIRGAVQQLDGDGFLQFNVRAQSLRVIRAS